MIMIKFVKMIESSLVDLQNFEPQKQIKCIVSHSDGSKEEIILNHSYNKFSNRMVRAGSALNVLRKRKLNFDVGPTGIEPATYGSLQLQTYIIFSSV